MSRLSYFYHFNDIDKNHKKVHNIQTKHQIVGFILFVLIFIIIIPFILYNIQQYTLLEVYFPNIDLVANLLSFHEGPFKIWKQLYVGTPLNLLSFISQIFINYLALMGVSFIFLRESKLTKNIYSGLSLAMIMILITYLIPAPLIIYVMEKFEYYLKKIKNNSFFCNECINIYTFVFGLILTILIILFEKGIIYYFRHHVINFLKLLI